MLRKCVFAICLVVLLNLASSVSAAPIPFSLLPTFDGHVGNDGQTGPDSSASTGSGMEARNIGTRRRVAFATYDISGIRAEGQVFQNVSFSNYGHDGGTIDVYGVLEAHEDLVATGLTWNNAPGVKNDPAPPLDTDVVLDLADVTGVLLTFDAPSRGTRASTETSQALADFLNSDTNGFVALMFAPNGTSSAIVRTVEMGADGGTLLEGQVAGAPIQARDPNPGDGVVDVSRDVVLSWTPGASAVRRDVYFGTSYEDVSAASVNNPLGVLASPGQEATSYDPPDTIEFGKTYYWRIDEVNAPPDSTVFPGSVWSFTVEPFSYPLEDIGATASSALGASMGPEKTVDGSGLNANDEHSTLGTDMWLSSGVGEPPAWIEYELDSIRRLDQMWVWNSNQLLETTFGLGLKDVTITYSTDGSDWMVLGDFEFEQAPGEEGYGASTTVNFDGVAAKYVKITASTNWGGLAQFGLSEVRIFHVPTQARVPEPASGAADVSPDVVLEWRPGREAAVHMLYFGTDRAAVAEGTAPVFELTEPSYAPPPLTFGTTYYWKVVEVNEARVPDTWDGEIWSFSTTEFAIVDDFERYTNDSPDRVFQTWTDGWGFSADPLFPDGHEGNGTGSLVGYDPAAGDIMETTIVQGPGQSMPVEYNNVDPPYYSEIERIWQTPQDWTLNGADTLGLFFRGNPIRFVETGPGSITMSAAGADIFNAADEFTYAYKSLNGDGSLTVRVDSLVNTDPWAKAGVMIRESLDPGSRFAGVYATPGNGVRFQARLITAGSATSDTSVATAEQIALQVPVWVRLERTGSAFNASYSTDGDVWTAMSWNPQTINMAGTIYIGLAVTSHNAGGAVTTSALSGITASSGISGPWHFAEIGIDHPLNDRADLYVALQDSANRVAVMTHPDPDAVLQDTWQRWDIPLADASDEGVDVAAITKMYIGVGDRKNPTPDGAGLLFIDDIGFGHPAPADPQP